MTGTDHDPTTHDPTTHDPTEHDPVAVLARACALAERQVEAAMANPDATTPCQKWTAAELVNHMVAVLRMWADVTVEIDSGYNPFDPPTMIGDHFIDDYRDAVAKVLAAFAAEGVLDKPLPGPDGEPVPGALLINLPIMDLYLHSWDLSQATGLVGEFPADLTELATGVILTAFPDGAERPPEVMGPAVDPPSGATPIETLAALAGRQA